MPRPLLALVLLAAACGARAPQPPQPLLLEPGPGDLPDEATILAEIDRERGFRDCFDVLRDPPLVPWRSASGMAPGELVVGLDLGTLQVAYPTHYLNYHEIVEQTLEGLNLLVCW